MANTQPAVLGKIKNLRITRNRLAAALIILAAVIIIITGALWGYAVMNNPQTKLVNAFQELSNEDAVAANFTIRAGESYNGEFNFQRDSDNKNDYRVNGNLAQNGEQINANLRSVGETFYLRLNGLENLGSLIGSAGAAQPESRFVQRFLQDLDGTWIEATEEDIAGFFGQSGAFNFGNTSEQDTEAIANAYEAHPFFDIEANGSEEIQGVDTNHLVLRYNKEQYIAFLEELQGANLETVEITDAQIENARQSDRAENAVIETWIAKGNGKFKRIKIYEEGNQSEYGQVTFKPADAENVNVDAPENSQSLQQIFQAFLEEVQVDAAAQPSAVQAE